MARSDGPSGFKIPSATSRLAPRRFAVSVESAERKVTGAKNVTETRSVAHTSVMLSSGMRDSVLARVPGISSREALRRRKDLNTWP